MANDQKRKESGMNITDLETKDIKVHSKKEFKKLIAYALGIGVFMAAGWWLTTYTQLLEVTSESLEGVRYILVRKSDSIQRGDIVSIEGHHPLYVGDHIFTKRVVGLPGDQITNPLRGKTENGLTIKAKNDSFTIIFPLLAYTKEGQVLTPLPNQAIPEGYIFIVGDHPRSFDSRYAEFGLVSMDKIYGKALLKW